MEQPRVQGFDIPLRELTEEEASREITIDRIIEFHHEVGEDFLDTADPVSIPAIFGGFLIGKYPEKAAEILDILNKKQQYLEVNSFRELFEDVFDENENDIYGVYVPFCEFVNLTVGTKKKTNQVLIQVAESYGYNS